MQLFVRSIARKLVVRIKTLGALKSLSRSDIKHVPEPAYEPLRQIAFDERRKIHDLVMEGVELAMKKCGYPTLADMKAKWQRKER